MPSVLDGEFVTVQRLTLWRLSLVLVAVGIGLRIIAYAADTSLSLDEILLAHNILDLPLRDLLTRPLQLDQVAPRGFLLVERLAVLSFGRNEHAMRLFPFLCSVAGLVLFWRLAERTLVGIAVPFAVGIFAIAVPFLRYAAQVKQYGIDAAVTVALLLLALDLLQRDLPTRRLLLIGLFGMVVVWFSQAAVFVLAGVGSALTVEWLLSREPRLKRALLTAIPLWAVASLVAVVAGERSMTESTRQFMDAFWLRGFMPLPPSLESVTWLWRQSVSLFVDPYLLRYVAAPVVLVVFLVGMVALWRGRRPVALILLGPIAVVLLAAVAHAYPFRSRLMLWTTPILLLGFAAGAEWLRRAASRVLPAAGAIVMAALLAPPVWALAKAPPPYDIEQHGRVLEYLRRHRQPGDVVYVFPLSRMGMLFYGPRYGLQPTEFITGVCDAFDTRAYVRDVDRFRGTSRLWVISAGVPPFRSARAAVREYLGTIGIERDSTSFPSLTYGTASLQLYDLSDTSRLRTANAASFPVPPMPTDPRPGCRPWIRPDAGIGNKPFIRR